MSNMTKRLFEINRKQQHLTKPTTTKNNQICLKIITMLIKITKEIVVDFFFTQRQNFDLVQAGLDIDLDITTDLSALNLLSRNLYTYF